MADTTQTVTNFSGNRRAIVTLWGISDGTGEDNATKVDINTMTVFDAVSM